MRKLGSLVAITLIIALALTGFAIIIAYGLTGNWGNSTTKPKPTTQAQSVKPPESLHWKDTAVPSNLDALRRSVEEIGYGFRQAGYAPISENIDNGEAPTTLVTHWLSPKGDVLVELHSSLGVTGISFKRADDPQYKALGPVWYRCAVPSATQLDMLALVNQLSKQSTTTLRAKCPIVTYGG